MKSKFFRIIIIAIIVITGTVAAIFMNAEKPVQSNFVQVENGQFVLNGEPYCYIGVNYWYGPLLGTKNGDRSRLQRELNFLKQHGVDNLRVMVGVEGISRNNAHAKFPLQTGPGEYDDNLLEGLDYFMSEVRKRDMKAVLFLTNNWEWSGGYAQYLNWAGKGEYPYPNEKGWPTFLDYISKFYDCKESTESFKCHCKYIIGRKNQYTNKQYADDTAIMAWEIANEPRPNGKHNKEIYRQWIGEMAKFIKLLDSNHLLTTGTEGEKGTENDIQLWKEIHSFPEIDYATIHIWAKNWNWINFFDFDNTFVQTKEKMREYIKEHAQIADDLHKPMVIEEIGFPRDGHSFNPSTTTICRDQYFDTMFDIMANGNLKSFQGANLWAFGGEGRASDTTYTWKPGDQLMGDPPQEEQGLNNIFDTDASTWKLIDGYNAMLNKKE